MSWYVYILKCRDSSFYIGTTNNLTHRLSLHNSKKGSKCLMGKLPVKLIYQEEYLDRSSACKREAEIKKWPRSRKEQLVKNL